MKWTRISIVCVIGLALNCAGGDEFAGGDGSGAGDGFLDGLVIDSESPDLVPGVIELAEGHVSTLGGPASATKEMVEGGPDFEIVDDGLEYSGMHGAQCSAAQNLCITEGGIVP